MIVSHEEDCRRTWETVKRKANFGHDLKETINFRSALGTRRKFWFCVSFGPFEPRQPSSVIGYWKDGGISLPIPESVITHAKCREVWQSIRNDISFNRTPYVTAEWPVGLSVRPERCLFEFKISKVANMGRVYGSLKGEEDWIPVTDWEVLR